MSQENVARVREGYDALGRGDPGPLAALMPRTSSGSSRTERRASGRCRRTPASTVAGTTCSPACSAGYRAFGTTSASIRGRTSTRATTSSSSAEVRANVPDSGAPAAAPFAHVWRLDGGQAVWWRCYEDTALLHHARGRAIAARGHCPSAAASRGPGADQRPSGSLRRRAGGNRRYWLPDGVRVTVAWPRRGSVAAHRVPIPPAPPREGLKCPTPPPPGHTHSTTSAGAVGREWSRRRPPTARGRGTTCRPPPDLTRPLAGPGGWGPPAPTGAAPGSAPGLGSGRGHLLDGLRPAFSPPRRTFPLRRSSLSAEGATARSGRAPLPPAA